MMVSFIQRSQVVRITGVDDVVQYSDCMYLFVNLVPGYYRIYNYAALRVVA